MSTGLQDNYENKVEDQVKKRIGVLLGGSSNERIHGGEEERVS